MIYFIMARLQILKSPDESLLRTSRPVTEFDERLHQLLDDMKETMFAAGGMGLAAPQVGRLVRAVVVEGRDGLVELVNPEVVFAKRQKNGEERCLSVPGSAYTVGRFQRIDVRAQSRFGEWFEQTFKGMDAVCVQHEIDHLDGKLITETGEVK